MFDVEDLEKRLREEYKPLYFARRALKAMKGEAPSQYAREIMGYLNYKHPSTDVVGEYIQRSKNLEDRQSHFEKYNEYKQSSYPEVKKISDERYKISLLLSIITTNHRFEITRELENYLQSCSKKTPNILSVGFGTGYEIKLAYDNVPECNIEAFDKSEKSLSYASSLLDYFGYKDGCLRRELFPLETKKGEYNFEKKYDKIILCELLEHLENPLTALKNAKESMSKNGSMFLTFAINIPQEDHVYLYKNVEDAKRQIDEAGLIIESDIFTPVTIMPFDEDERRNFDRGNYVCIAKSNK
jgi:2-polyprenyl-3-methyl-5-hydroxy-6-metoxy-1,4-benzoquinol methylase